MTQITGTRAHAEIVRSAKQAGAVQFLALQFCEARNAEAASARSLIGSLVSALTDDNRDEIARMIESASAKEQAANERVAEMIAAHTDWMQRQ